MSGVEGVGGQRRAFDREEEEALRRDESTSVIMNRVRKDAGCGEAVEIHGNDKTRRELDIEFKSHVGRQGGVELAKAAFEGSHLAEVGFAEAAWAPVAGAVGGFVMYGFQVHEMERQKAELQDAIVRDELHASLLTQIDIPPGWKSIEVGRRPDAGKGPQSDTQKMETQFVTKDRALVATLQLHADRGMHAALDCTTAGVSKEQFFATHQTQAEQYKNDAAFRDGFDAMMWAKERSPSELEAAKKGLVERDARYAASQVQVRG